VSHMHAWRLMQALGVSELKNPTKFDSLEAYHSTVSCELEREIVQLLESRNVG
jgi:aryl-alcohol dehydrogenase-like predicted oxidoreductase